MDVLSSPDEFASDRNIDRGRLAVALDEAQRALALFYRHIANVESALTYTLDEIGVTSMDVVSSIDHISPDELIDRAMEAQREYYRCSASEVPEL